MFFQNLIEKVFKIVTPTPKPEFKISDQGLNLIRAFEGCHKKLPNGKIQAYQDPVGIWTIGWGTTGKLLDGRKVKEGLVITLQEAATELTKKIEKRYGAHVNKVIAYKINQNQFDALTSLAYNRGSLPSALIALINSGDFSKTSITYEFMKVTRAKGVVLKGLIRRRKAELELFFAEK